MPSKDTAPGHRKRLREKFIKSGFGGFNDQEILELFLGLHLPRRECHKLAKECLEYFKDLRGFLVASPQELEQVGLTLDSILCVRLLRDLPAEILRRRIVNQSVYESSQEIFDYLYYSMQDLKKEVRRRQEKIRK